MSQLADFVAAYGLPLIFALVLVEQLGAPIPALPALVVAGALSMDRDLSAWQALAAGVAACLAADSIWFAVGRRQGRRVLKTLCRVSLSPDSCVRQTESFFERWGMPSLLVAKFVPGFSTVAPPLAGAVRTGWPTFLAYDLGGSLLWAGAGVGGGVLFHRAIDQVLASLAAIGSRALVVVGAALALFVALKWGQRRRFYRLLRASRITVEELRRWMDEGKEPLVFDVRTAGGRARDPWRIAGANVLDVDALDAGLRELGREREIVVYCT